MQKIAKTQALREAYVNYELANPGFAGSKGTGANFATSGGAGGKREGAVKGLGLLGKE